MSPPIESGLNLWCSLISGMLRSDVGQLPSPCLKISFSWNPEMARLKGKKKVATLLQEQIAERCLGSWKLMRERGTNVPAIPAEGSVMWILDPSVQNAATCTSPLIPHLAEGKPSQLSLPGQPMVPLQKQRGWCFKPLGFEVVGCKAIGNDIRIQHRGRHCRKAKGNLPLSLGKLHQRPQFFIPSYIHTLLLYGFLVSPIKRKSIFPPPLDLGSAMWFALANRWNRSYDVSRLVLSC